ncbi:DUF362 domain-containing protein [Acidobacteriota bacterium]
MHPKGKAWTRRDFLRGTLGATLGVSLMGTKFVTPGTKPAGSSLVTLVRDKNAMDGSNTINPDVLKAMLDQTVIKCTGQNTAKEAWSSLFKPEDTVGLVPTPHLNPTHSEVVDAVKSSLIAAGIPKEKIVNAQGGPNLPKSCTALITMPGLKAHWLTGIGTVLKNYIMYSGNPRKYHDANSAKLGEIWNLPFVKGKTRLVLVDALHPLCDKGPQSDPRYKWAYNGLIAGTDPVAVDAVCLRIIMEKRKAMRGEPWPLSPPPICVESADKVYGLGTSDWSKIKVKNYGWDEELLLG